MNTPFPFKIWLSRTVRPIALLLGLGVFFLYAVLAYSFIDGTIVHFRQSSETWARNAEVLLQKGEASTLDVMAEFFLKLQSGTEIIIEKKGKMLWSFPDSNVNRSASTKNKSYTVEYTLQPSGDLLRFQVPLVKLLLFPVIMLTIVLLTAAALLVAAYLAFQRWNRRFLIELSALQAGHSSEISELQQFIDAFRAAVDSKADLTARAQLSDQVIHDVRSPLSVLNITAKMLTADSQITSETLHLLTSATKRIQEVIADLSLRKPNAKKTNVQLVSRTHVLSEVENSCKEMGVLFKTHAELEIIPKISTLDRDVSINLPTSDFSRILTNLINNAAEACNFRGKIFLELETNSEEVLLRVRDFGKGIPEEILVRIGERGFSHEKSGVGHSGSGLGIWSARKTLESFGAKLMIESTIGSGTVVSLLFPKTIKARDPARLAPALMHELM